MDPKQIVSTSRFLSLVLRHRPEIVGLQLDAEGWLEIKDLLAGATKRGRAITTDELREVVLSNDKKRFAISEDGLRIRASQGHSVRSVSLDLNAIAPPDILYHGTVEKFIESIRRQGLIKRTRNHVHLSIDETTATKVGSRRGEPTILKIAASQMHRDGHEFFLSENGVWLTESVPTKFMSFP